MGLCISCFLPISSHWSTFWLWWCLWSASSISGKYWQKKCCCCFSVIPSLLVASSLCQTIFQEWVQICISKYFESIFPQWLSVLWFLSSCLQLSLKPYQRTDRLFLYRGNCPSWSSHTPLNCPHLSSPLVVVCGKQWCNRHWKRSHFKNIMLWLKEVRRICVWKMYYYTLQMVTLWGAEDGWSFTLFCILWVMVAFVVTINEAQ